MRGKNNSDLLFYLSHIISREALMSGALQTERRTAHVLNRVSVCNDKAFHHYDSRCKWQERVARPAFHLHIPRSDRKLNFRINAFRGFDLLWDWMGCKSCQIWKKDIMYFFFSKCTSLLFKDQGFFMDSKPFFNWKKQIRFFQLDTA